jgi:hypothetical protein
MRRFLDKPPPRKNGPPSASAVDPPEEARRIAANIAKLPAFLSPKHQR